MYFDQECHKIQESYPYIFLYGQCDGNQSRGRPNKKWLHNTKDTVWIYTISQIINRRCILFQRVQREWLGLTFCGTVSAYLSHTITLQCQAFDDKASNKTVAWCLDQIVGKTDQHVKDSLMKTPVLNKQVWHRDCLITESGWFLNNRRASC